MLICLCSLAAFGYVVNDIFDIEEDWQKDGAIYHIGDIIAYDLASGQIELVFSPTEKQAVHAGNSMVFPDRVRWGLGDVAADQWLACVRLQV